MALTAVKVFADRRLDFREGADIKSWHTHETPADKWKAVAEEWARTHQPDRPLWNISLARDGTIVTILSLYDEASQRVSKADADTLFALTGRAPEQLVIDFTLHQLVNHFLIPDVPDVARVNPIGYDRNLKLIEEIEILCTL